MKSAMLSKEARWLALGLLVVSVVVWIGWTAPWQSARAQAQKVTFIYSAKYVCAPDFGPPDPALVPGIYKTAINVRNFLAQEVKFTKKVVVSRGQDEPRGPISERETVTLKPDEAIDIDCPDMAKLLKEQKAGSPKGFVVIESQVELEVVAVYTNEIVTREERSDTKKEFTCWNKVVYFELPEHKPGEIPTGGRARPLAPGVNVPLEPHGQQEIPLPNQVNEIVLPCPPPPQRIPIQPGQTPHIQPVPEGVNVVKVVNNGPGGVLVGVQGPIPPRAPTPGLPPRPLPPIFPPGVPVGPAGSISLPVEPGDQVVIAPNPAAPGPAEVTKVKGIDDLQDFLRRLLKRPIGAPPIVIAKKIIDIERSNKVPFVFKVPVGLEHLAPLPPGQSSELILPAPPPGVPINLSEAVRSVINDELKATGRALLDPRVRIEILADEYGVGKGAASVGPEVEMGIGQGVGFGLGLGVGAGISIDVEYIQPKRVER